MCRKRDVFIDTYAKVLGKADVGLVIKDDSIPHEAYTMGVEQLRPWTFVKVAVEWGDKNWVVGRGFSKVSFPDRWDADEGKGVALRKALANVWRQTRVAPHA